MIYIDSGYLVSVFAQGKQDKMTFCLYSDSMKELTEISNSLGKAKIMIYDQVPYILINRETRKEMFNKGALIAGLKELHRLKSIYIRMGWKR